VLGAAYMLWLYQRTMWGKLDNPENEKLKDLDIREMVTLIPLIILAFWIGLYPKPFFRILEKPVARLVQQVHHQWNGSDDDVASAPALPVGAAAPLAQVLPGHLGTGAVDEGENGAAAEGRELR